MRRTLAAVAAAVAIFGLAAPLVFAQAPAPSPLTPKVTIVGLFDQIISANKNVYDGNFALSQDAEWYGRTRFRPDFEFAVGRVKAVLGLEIDLQWGGCGLTGGSGSKDTAGANGCHTGTSGGSALNTDVPGVLEVKWLYTEFPLTGKDSLLPFIPVETVARAGLQPFASIANYKTAYANGDFAGVSSVTTFTPAIRLNLGYVQSEEQTANVRSPVLPGAQCTTAGVNCSRGEDYALIGSLDITPFKGLDIKPMFSWFHADSSTSTSSRRVVNDVSFAGGNSNSGPGTGTTLPTNAFQEQRYTVGFDARWRFGPFALDPTFYYQFGNQDYARSAAGGGGGNNVDIGAWLFDVIGGYQLGPLLLEARGIYSSGNKAGDQLANTKKKYYEPINLDTGYYAGWAAILALGVDYFNGGGGANGYMDTNVGYDRYGRAQLGVRATYAITPALNISGVVSPTWTAESVDTNTAVSLATPTSTGSAGIRSAPGGNGQPVTENSRYIGTETDLQMDWRFSANTVFSLQGAYLFAGPALDACVPQAGVAAGGECGAGFVKEDSKNAWIIAARVRLSF
jgi:hypothetical protein